MESKDTLDKWEYETLNYIRPTGKNNEVDDHDYLNQSIEIDAIGFTPTRLMSSLESRLLFQILSKIWR